VVVPTGKVAGALFDMLGMSQLSNTTGVPNEATIAEQLDETGTVIFVGAKITGATKSTTVIV
jgi:hypothetical protein